MAAFPCPECGESVSEYAETCPHCGVPKPAEMKAKQEEMEWEATKDGLKALAVIGGIMLAGAVVSAIVGAQE